MDKDIKEMFEIIIDKMGGMDSKIDKLEKEQKSLSNQVTTMEYRLTDKVNGLYDGYEVVKDDIRRIEKSVNKLVLADQDKDLRIRNLMNVRI